MTRNTNTYRISLLIITLFLCSLYSCKPPNERNCFKGAGESDSLIVELPHFSKLVLDEHMTFVLVQDTVEKVRIYGGENLLNHIVLNTDNTEEIIISNENRCRFLRYKNNEILVYIHFIHLDELIYNGSETLSNDGILQLDDIQITTTGAAGSINLNLTANEIYNYNELGWPDITLSGSCDFLRSEILGNMYINSKNLLVNESINYISRAGTLSNINADGCELKVELSGTGDLWYYGLPLSIDKKEYNSGKLIDKN